MLSIVFQIEKKQGYVGRTVGFLSTVVELFLEIVMFEPACFLEVLLNIFAIYICLYCTVLSLL